MKIFTFWLLDENFNLRLWKCTSWPLCSVLARLSCFRFRAAHHISTWWTCPDAAPLIFGYRCTSIRGCSEVAPTYPAASKTDHSCYTSSSAPALSAAWSRCLSKDGRLSLIYTANFSCNSAWSTVSRWWHGSPRGCTRGRRLSSLRIRVSRHS